MFTSKNLIKPRTLILGLEDEEVYRLNDQGYSPEQIEAIAYGKRIGLTPIEDTRYEAWRMYRIFRACYHGYDTSFYLKLNPAFNKDQCYEIYCGQRNNVDVSIFANPIFSAEQMREIRLALKSHYYHYNVAKLAKPEFSAEQMCAIRHGLDQGHADKLDEFAEADLSTENIYSMINVLDREKQDEALRSAVDTILGDGILQINAVYRR